MADIHTPEARWRTMEKIRRTMSADLAAALRARQRMGPAAVERAEELILALGSIKGAIERRARSLGYTQRCRQAIEVCGGECCIWHFPKTITAADFLIAVFDLSEKATTLLADQVRETPGEPVYQCPLLRKDGCIFDFRNRPLVCTAAFPCMAGQPFWKYKERFRTEIEALRAALGRLISAVPGGRDPDSG